MPLTQPGLFADVPPGLPPGFAYRPDFLSADEETALLAELADLPFEPFQFRGFEARRRVCSFGYRYDPARGAVAGAKPIPTWLQSVRTRAEAFAGVAPGGLSQLLINEYLPGRRSAGTATARSSRRWLASPWARRAPSACAAARAAASSAGP
ncbi:alpha-ketoglutarate-dependent dioxygenase AlkB [Phenylobacterium sp. J367]|uniref:alpha-ketoglutarate-dependent dioxygenase AlkB n=1 Tax=Phenylobacterium sp. J367 TaxID=2898435 RepID=UPI002151C845|nr:alpha-ketoglutarate-dependent dioxygenase AlkB [Phenylobacterium sp. J367]MCR5877905.1 alpha-ketoglutarate-dependent dioxygenase AlkB [Phenylobacterium sp. J367]